MMGGNGNVRLSANWEDPFGPSEKELLDSLTVKQGLGVSEEQILTEAGYGETDITRMQQQNAARRKASQAEFNAQ
jgi:hypothetical protein